MEKYGTARQAIVWRMRFAGRITKERPQTNQNIYTMRIAFLRQRLRERAPILRYTYSGCLLVPFAYRHIELRTMAEDGKAIRKKLRQIKLVL